MRFCVQMTFTIIAVPTIDATREQRLRSNRKESLITSSIESCNKEKKSSYERRLRILFEKNLNTKNIYNEKKEYDIFHNRNINSTEDTPYIELLITRNFRSFAKCIPLPELSEEDFPSVSPSIELAITSSVAPSLHSSIIPSMRILLTNDFHLWSPGEGDESFGFNVDNFDPFLVVESSFVVDGFIGSTDIFDTQGNSFYTL